jgi:hypothetical protein
MFSSGLTNPLIGEEGVLYPGFGGFAPGQLKSYRLLVVWNSYALRCLTSTYTYSLAASDNYSNEIFKILSSYVEEVIVKSR